VLAVQSGLSIPHSSRINSLEAGTALAVGFSCLNKLRHSYTQQGSRLLKDQRQAERERIARELHDTLLQGLQGILLEIEVFSRSSALSDEQRERAVKIEQKLRYIVTDGRNAINALRLPDDDEKDWMSVVLDMGDRAALESKINFSLKIRGDAWNLPLKVRIEVLAIIREALRNAFEHSKAQTIRVAVKYAKHGLRVSIRDNGIGVSGQHVQLRQEEGHWGIAGMRERAEKLRGRLTIVSQLSVGTAVNLVIPKRLRFMSPSVPCKTGARWRWAIRRKCPRHSSLRQG
jgi:signal transduction histidine kinase